MGTQFVSDWLKVMISKRYVIGVQRVSYCELLFLTTIGLTNQKRAVTFIARAYLSQTSQDSWYTVVYVEH